MIKRFIAATVTGILLTLSLAPATVRAEDEPPAPPIYNIQITELLPNPASPQIDSQDEYIELYNPYDVAVDLNGYTLYTGSVSAAYDKSLAGITIGPQEYKAFYSRDTNLTLVNSSAGQAWLVSPKMVRIAEVPPYPANIGENKAWALIAGQWQVTAELTPGIANPVPSTAEPPAPVSVTEPAHNLDPCPEGKYRNPETNRCKAIESTAEAELTPCKPGQARNPETNRCRTVTSSTELTACDEGEERNPETNRCRKTTTNSTTPAPCQTGYERNPETNRCKKITAVKAAVSTAPSQKSARNPVNYLIIITITLMIAGYAAYEYRADISNLYNQFKNRNSRVKK